MDKIRIKNILCKFTTPLKKMSPILLGLIIAFIIGQFSQISTVYGDPVIGGGVFEFTSSGVSGTTYTVETAGLYNLRCKAEQGGAYNLTSGKGGDLTASLELAAGDVLVVTRLEGGTSAATSYIGGDAVIVSLNGTYILGAGGAGGNWETASGSFQRIASDVTEINNSSFSSGAGGGCVTSSNKVRVGTNGNTISGCTAAVASSGYAGQSGTNYLNLDYCTLVSNTGSSTTVGVVLIYQGQPEPSTADLQEIQNRLTVLEGNTHEDIVKVTVCANQAFDIRIYHFDSNAVTQQAIQISSEGINVGTINVTNQAIGDDFIQVAGSIEDPGYYNANYGNEKIYIHAIEEPNSTNVYATFN